MILENYIHITTLKEKKKGTNCKNQNPKYTPKCKSRIKFGQCTGKKVSLELRFVG